MKKTLKLVAIAATMVMTSVTAFSQKASPDAAVNYRDSVVIRLNDYEGSIQWQRSLNLEAWENIPAANQDTLLIVADVTSYFRAEVVAGNCDPFYSETAMVVVAPILPNVQTLPVTNITSTTARSGGNVTSHGGAAVTARGVVWCTNPNPTISNNQGYTTDGSGTGEFISILTGLTAGTQYHIRAYATNSEGTGYGQQLIFSDHTQVIDIISETGQIWMDRNLGASRAAISSNDSEAYGHLYQWGRAADCHQERTSGITSNLSGTDTPGHENFILAPVLPYDWRSPQNPDLWQGVNGINNPCPAGYRLPTEAELNAERLSWSSNNAAGAFASPLKLTMAGFRDSDNGALIDEGFSGGYWSSSVSITGARGLGFDLNSAYMAGARRAGGGSVRCIKGATEATLPGVETLPVTNITSTTAQSGGNVTSHGGAAVSARGVIWCTNPNPTISNNQGYTTDGSGTGEFISIMSGLTAGTLYYIRAYATNSAGTGYGQQLIFADTQVVDVISATGKTWMDRNLGASRVAISSTDSEAYGHLYQWGRAADGHQKRTSGTTSNLSNSDTPGHGNYIVAPNTPYDWRSPQNNYLWQGENGINNPCPAGYRLPTEAELDEERLSWSSENAEGAFASPLKLTMAGYRDSDTGGFIDVGSTGGYWSSTVNGILVRGLGFDLNSAYMAGARRAGAGSVRCIKD